MACFLAVLAVLTVRARFDDPDMWWHLKTGEVIWSTHSIPTTDLFSYTTNHHALIPQEWLPEALIYASYRLGGYSGMMLWLCLFGAALLIAGYVLCSIYSGNAKVAFLGAMIVWFFATVGLSVRPQLVGYLLLIFELLLVHLGQTRNWRWFFGLPPLFALWVNCHGSFLFGLGVLGVFLICSFFDFQAGPLVAEPWETHSRHRFMLAAVLSVAAAFVNPGGVRQVFYPLDTMLHQPINLGNVQEWKPLVVSDPRGAGLLAVIVLVLVVLIADRTEKLFLHEAALLAIGAWLALSHQRLAIVFGILAAPVVSRLLQKSWDNYDAAKDRPVPNAVFGGLALVAAFLAFPGHENLVRQVESGSPVKAVEYIKTHQLSGNMLNSYGDGGYLIWALPEHPVFIDGRADVYEWAGVLGEFGRWAMLQSDPNAMLDKYHVDFCLLERDSPMSFVFPLMPNWKKVYSDDASVIFVRTSPSVSSN